MRSGPVHHRPKALERAAFQARGFTLIELVFTIAITFVLVAMAVPMIKSVYGTYQLRGSVSTTTGAIQSTRYQALQTGYPYRLVLTQATSSMQVQGPDPKAPDPLVLINLGGVLPLSGSGNQVALSADTTLNFHPGGRIDSPQADATGTVTLTLAQGGKNGVIKVSRYGNINVTYP